MKRRAVDSVAVHSPKRLRELPRELPRAEDLDLDDIYNTMTNIVEFEGLPPASHGYTSLGIDSPDSVAAASPGNIFATSPDTRVAASPGEIFNVETLEDPELLELLREMDSRSLAGNESPKYQTSTVEVEDVGVQDASRQEFPASVEVQDISVQEPGFQDLLASVDVNDTSADWRLRPSLPDNPKMYFTTRRFLDLHCPFITTMLEQLSPTSVTAVNVQTTRDAGKVLAVAREFLTSITSDLAKAARTVITLVASGENVFALPKSKSRVYNSQSPRMLLFFKDVLAWALQEKGISTPEDLQALWRKQLQDETPAEYLQILLGVMYMVLLANEMKMSREPYSMRDQKAAASQLRDFIMDIPRRHCA